MLTRQEAFERFEAETKGLRNQKAQEQIEHMLAEIDTLLNSAVEDGIEEVKRNPDHGLAGLYVTYQIPDSINGLPTMKLATMETANRLEQNGWKVEIEYTDKLVMKEVEIFF